MSRFSAIASVRAPTIATVTHTMFARPGQPSTARKAPTYANGSANTVCSIRTSDARRRGSGTEAAVTSAGAASPCLRRRARARGRSAGWMTAKPSRQPPGDPGRFTTSVRPRRPATPRESSACGVRAIASARIASASPGASRSSNAPRRLRRHVSRGESGASRCQYEQRIVLVDELADRVGDRVQLVGDDRGGRRRSPPHVGARRARLRSRPRERPRGRHRTP